MRRLCINVEKSIALQANPVIQKEKLENKNPCWSGRRLKSLRDSVVLCGTLRFPEWKTQLKRTLLSQGQKKKKKKKGEIRWNNDKKRRNKWVTRLPEGRLCRFYECEDLFLALHRHLWKMCHCCIPLRAPCQEERNPCTWHVPQEGARDWPHLSGGLHSWLKDQQGQRLPWM